MVKINIRILEDKKEELIVKPKINIVKKDLLLPKTENIIKESSTVFEEEILNEDLREGPKFSENELLNEEWKSLEFFGYDNYSISNLGRFSNNKKNILINGTIQVGYRRVSLSHNSEGKSHPIHRLVAFAFLGTPEDKTLTVDHIKRKETLNNRATNLKWSTRSEQAQNQDHSNKRGPIKAIKQSKLDGTLIKIWSSRIEAATTLSLPKSSINRVVKSGKPYRGFPWSKLDIEYFQDEEWNYIKKSEGYQVSTRGRILSKFGEIMKGSIKDGYLRINIKIDGIIKSKYVHILVAKAFLPKSSPPVVNHKDGNKLNNFVENLEFTTKQDNIQHAYDMGLNKGSPKVKVGKYDKITGEELERFDSYTEARASIEKGNISYALDNSNRTSGGFVWRRLK